MMFRLTVVSVCRTSVRLTKLVEHFVKVFPSSSSGFSRPSGVRSTSFFTTSPALRPFLTVPYTLKRKSHDGRTLLRRKSHDTNPVPIGSSESHFSCNFLNSSFVAFKGESTIVSMRQSDLHRQDCERQEVVPAGVSFHKLMNVLNDFSRKLINLALGGPCFNISSSTNREFHKTVRCSRARVAGTE